MKRMTLIAAALCLIMLTTVGAGVVAAKQQENPRQAGSSHIYFLDVAATDSHGTGKLIVNVDKHTFVFNGKDFTPSKTYYLRYTVAGIAGVHTFASAVATRAGTLHVEGAWMIDLRLLPTAPAITASTSPTPPLQAGFTLTWSRWDGSFAMWTFDFSSSSGPISTYKVVMSVSGLGDFQQVGPTSWPPNWNEWGGAYGPGTDITFTLTVYDGAGHESQTAQTVTVPPRP